MVELFTAQCMPMERHMMVAMLICATAGLLVANMLMLLHFSILSLWDALDLEVIQLTLKSAQLGLEFAIKVKLMPL
jgi:hypothetical protein